MDAKLVLWTLTLAMGACKIQPTTSSLAEDQYPPDPAIEDRVTTDRAEIDANLKQTYSDVMKQKAQGVDIHEDTVTYYNGLPQLSPEAQSFYDRFMFTAPENLGLSQPALQAASQSPAYTTDEMQRRIDERDFSNPQTIALTGSTTIYRRDFREGFNQLNQQDRDAIYGYLSNEEDFYRDRVSLAERNIADATRTGSIKEPVVRRSLENQLSTAQGDYYRRRAALLGDAAGSN